MTFKVHLDGYNLAALPDRPGEESPRKEFFYFNDDQRAGRPALRQLEACFHGTAGHGNAADLGRTVHHAAGAEDLQSPDRPLRAGGHHVEHLLRLAASTMPSSSSRRRTIVGKFLPTFKEFPPSQKAAQLQPRRGAGKADGKARLAGTNVELTETLTQYAGPHSSQDGCGPACAHKSQTPGSMKLRTQLQAPHVTP